MFHNKSFDPIQVFKLFVYRFKAQVLTLSCYGNSMVTILTAKIMMLITETLVSKINDKTFDNTGHCFCTCLHYAALCLIRSIGVTHHVTRAMWRLAIPLNPCRKMCNPPLNQSLETFLGRRSLPLRVV